MSDHETLAARLRRYAGTGGYNSSAPGLMREAADAIEQAEATVARSDYLAEAWRLQCVELQATVARLTQSLDIAARENIALIEACHDMQGEKARATAAETERDALLKLARVVLKSVRDDERGEQWTIRAFLDERGVFHENLTGSRRLVREACQSVLAAHGEEDQ